MAKYNPKKIEKKWAKYWIDKKTFVPDLEKSKNPYYALFMFPYPSAEGLHIGNFYAFTSVDVMAKYMRLKGFDVYEPVGWDAFGIHSENYALKIGQSPEKMLQRTIKNFRHQLQTAGLSCDWTREVNTTDPEYYKWTQWIFTKLFEKGLAYQKEAQVSWCPDCKTVLADEQIEAEGVCERCKATVEKRKMKQWFFKITAYAERLLGGLENMDWSEITKSAQRNWIGKSEGAEIRFKIKNTDYNFTIFTTRPDTIFGATFAILAPEHELLTKLKDKIKNWEKVEKYIAVSEKKSELERGILKQKTGIKLEGICAVNPVRKKEIPIFVADFVLGSYGTGAIMSVPAHDERDFEFAKKFDLPITPVVEQPKDKNNIIWIYDDDDSKLASELRRSGLLREHATPTIAIYEFQRDKCKEIISLLKNHKVGSKKDYKKIEDGNGFTLETKPSHIDFLRVYSGDGEHVNSEFLNGLNNQDAIAKVNKWLEKNKFGKREIIYKLRDWCISRQRYWGPPIPVVYCEKCGTVAAAEKDLPVRLPELKKGWEPAGDGKGPLAKVESFVKTKCPKCGGEARRESDVMDNFLDSAWYFFRYISPKNKKEIFDKKLGKKWLPVDLYVGGNEHAVLHLMYTRFITMALHDLGLTDFDNPFKKFRANGMILKDGKKMSKSKGNVVNPEEYGDKLGYDALKSYLLFLGPLSEDRSFSDEGIRGLRHWAERVFNLGGRISKNRDDSEVTIKKLYQTIKAVEDDMDHQKYNTAIAKLMELTNTFYAAEKISVKSFEKYLIIVSVFLPALAEELWHKLGKKKSIFLEKWPKFDPKLIVEKEVDIVIQVNGKVRDQITVSLDAKEDDIKRLAFESEKIKKYIPSVGNIRKIIFVPGRLINFVV